jgi:hypothetical protein
MNELRPGNLVRIIRPSIGVPRDTIGLIVEGFTSPHRASFDPKEIWIVELLNGLQRRYLGRDLEKIN